MKPTLPSIVVDPLQQTFGDLLFGAAGQLVGSGCVLEVRVLQGGSVVTGIVGGDAAAGQPGGGKHRVYVRYQAGRAPDSAIDSAVAAQNISLRMEGECSCGERSPCVHVAAVVIAARRAADRTMQGDPVARQMPGGLTARPMQSGPARPGGVTARPISVPLDDLADTRVASVARQSGPALRQQLCYLVEKLRPDAGHGGRREFRVSVWVAQTASSSRAIIAGSACPFVPRFTGGRSATRGSSSGPSMIGHGEFPRYVDAQDREILSMLTAQRDEGPWELHGEMGADLLRRVVATGRAFRQSPGERGPGGQAPDMRASVERPADAQAVEQALRGATMRAGAPRRVVFLWEALANGNQQLSWEDAHSLEVILGIEPPMYIDSMLNEAGTVELPCPVDLLRHYVGQAAVVPEQVAAMNEQLARAVGTAAVPQLRTILLQPQVLSRLQGRLVLAADLQAIVQFVYNGLAVEAQGLQDQQDSVRRLAGDVLWEIPRDRDGELKLRSRLDLALQPAPDSREEWLTFMMDGVAALRRDGWEVAVDDGFPYRIVTPNNWYADLHADRQPGWFNLRLGVMVDGQSINLLPALTRYLQSSLEAGAVADEAQQSANDMAGCRIGDDWLVRLDDGRYLPVGLERIERIANTLVELFDRDSLNSQEALVLPRSQGGRLAQLAADLNSPPAQSAGMPLRGAETVLRSDDSSLRSLIQDLEGFSGIQPLRAPAGFRGTLRPYQEEGLGWLQFLRRYGLGGILADDMGLGKTVQTIAHITLELEQGRLHKPVLIVAPVSALGNWSQEFRRFAPGLAVMTWHGSQRKKSLPALEQAQVILTAYPLLLLDSEVLQARDFALVILDEAQMIKNPRAKVAQMARQLRAECRLCLSGTPVENHLGELWSLFDFLQPGLLGDERHFQQHYRTPVERNGDGKRAQALSARLAPFLLRRTKDSVAKELPPKMEIVETILLDEKQRDFYDGIRLAMHQRIQEVIRQQGLARSQITILDALLKLRQVCCDPRLIDVQAANAGIPSAKLEWLTAVLPGLVAEGRRVLLFSQFTAMLRLIEAAVTGLGIPYCLLTGQIRDRTAVVDRFQSGNVPLFLISLKAGGTALNLTAADTVIHYDPWWNPAVEAQATDRAHRIGQTRPVFVYKLIAQDTVEERMMQLQADKRVLADRLYSEKTAAPTTLGAADLELLFAP